MKKDEVRVLFPSVVQFADSVRAVFGNGVKLTYASENGREIGKRQHRDPERTVRITAEMLQPMYVDDVRARVADDRALPSHMYRDPAEVVEQRELRRMGCRACTSHEVVMGRVVCMDVRNELQKGVPGIGHRCRWFAG